MGKCNRKIECTQEIYEIKDDRLEFRDVDPYNRSVISIMRPIVPDQVVTYTQKMSFVELVCFLGSLVSLYFGFTIIMLNDIITLVSKFIYNNVSIVLNSRIKCWQTKTTQNNIKINIAYPLSLNINNLIVNNVPRNFNLKEKRSALGIFNRTQ